MIVTVVRFPAIEPLGPDEARARFGANAASYLERDGLLWKAYLRSDDGSRIGGVYWWRDRPSAEAAFNDGWRSGVTEKYGAEPSVEYFDAPVVVDGVAGVVRVDAPMTWRETDQGTDREHEKGR